MVNRSISENIFNKILLETIEETLQTTLGDIATTSIYQNLECIFGIKKNQIPQKLYEFSNTLEKILGIGARNIEILLIKNFYKKIKITCTWPNNEDSHLKIIDLDLTFTEYIKNVKKRYLKNHPQP